MERLIQHSRMWGRETETIDERLAKIIHENPDVWTYKVVINFPRCDQRVLYAKKSEITEEAFLATCSKIRGEIFSDLCEY